MTDAPPPPTRRTLVTVVAALFLARTAISIVGVFVGLALLGLIVALAVGAGLALQLTHP